MGNHYYIAKDINGQLVAFRKLKKQGIPNGMRLENGMLVDMAPKSFSRPINTNPREKHPLIAQLFMNKYGVDVLKANAIPHMLCDKIDLYE